MNIRDLPANFVDQLKVLEHPALIDSGNIDLSIKFLLWAKTNSKCVALVDIDITYFPIAKVNLSQFISEYKDTILILNAHANRWKELIFDEFMRRRDPNEESYELPFFKIDGKKIDSVFDLASLVQSSSQLKNKSVFSVIRRVFREIPHVIDSDWGNNAAGNYIDIFDYNNLERYSYDYFVLEFIPCIVHEYSLVVNL